MYNERMNLGDGLMFELENGKPKLVLTLNDESKASNQTGFCQDFKYQVSQKNRPLKTTATSKLGPKEEERDRQYRDSRGANHVEHGSQKMRTKSRTDDYSNIKGIRVQSAYETKSTDAQEKTVPESLVFLTPAQLQQILKTINASGRNDQSDSAACIWNDAGTYEEETETPTSATGQEQQITSRGNKEKTLSDFSSAGLFSTFGEREQKKDTIQAKKAQWRRELDEQMALKKQQKERAKVLAHGEKRRGTETRTRSGDQRSGVQEDRTKPTSTETVNKQPPASHSHKNMKALPTANRSAFVLGEATPLEQAFSEEKKEQQRLWLQDLEQQREEIKLRRKLEKQSQNQPDNHEHWARHFDSFQRNVPVKRPPAAELNLGNNQHTPSQALSTALETMSSCGKDTMGSCGKDTMGEASVLTTQGFQPKTSYLRTMTALLDPAQIEARELRRTKQLELQRAIVAQMEEQRRQKEKEEAAQQIIEQVEERRIAKQREQQEQQHLRETQLQREKEEMTSRKTQHLYMTMQKASEEAQKDKRLQRIQHLHKKGDDVSNLLRTNSQAVIGQSSESLPTLNPITEVPETDRKDVAIQTEINPGSPSPKNSGGQAAFEYKAPPNIKRSRREGRVAEKNSGKENVCTAVKGADVYEAGVQTDKTHEQQLLTRPDWNTQRPKKPFVPASERYPAELQRLRQENKMRRQTELMTLVERNTPSRTSHQETAPQSGNPAHVQLEFNLAHQKDEESHRVQSASQRVPSPPVPALRHRLQTLSQSGAEEKPESSGRCPSTDYVPYVRTDEVYHLDPLAPISRPATQEGAQKIHADASKSRQHNPEQRDPFLYHELLKSTKRQQAILKGLSELRQGLLQKQRALETGFSPLLQEQSRNQSSAFQPP